MSEILNKTESTISGEYKFDSFECTADLASIKSGDGEPIMYVLSNKTNGELNE